MARCLEAGVTPEHFYAPKHQLIFAGLQEVYAEGAIIDEYVLAEALKKGGRLEEVGDYAAISRITNTVETNVNFPAWLKIVCETKTLRDAIRAAQEITDRCKMGDYTSADAQAAFVAASRAIQPPLDATDLINPFDKAFEEINDAFIGKAPQQAVCTGFPMLNTALKGGYMPENLYYLLGQSEHGKSAYGFHSAIKSAAKGFRWLIFSLEMSSSQTAKRMICQQAGIPLQRLIDFRYGEHVNAYRDAHIATKNLPIIIEARSITIDDMYNKIDLEHSKTPLHGILLDSLQYLKAAKPGTDPTEVIYNNGLALKQFAKEFKLPIVCVVQANKDGGIFNSPKSKYHPDVCLTIDRDTKTNEGWIGPDSEAGKYREGRKHWKIEMTYEEAVPRWIEQREVSE